MLTDPWLIVAPLFFLPANVLSSELDEARLLLDTSERAKRNLEAEVAEARNAIGQLSNANSALTVERRRLEGDARGMQTELENLMNQVKNAEEKARKAMMDAGWINAVCFCAHTYI